MATHEELLRRMRDDGYCIIEDVIPADAVDEVRERVRAASRAGQEKYKPGAEGVSFVGGLLAREQSFAPYLADPRIVALAEALMGPHIRVSYTSAIVNEPGKPRGDWHADWPFNQKNAGHIPAPYPDICCHLTSLWMLSPFTRENGGTLIVPGSHRTTNNPTGGNGVDPWKPYPSELLVTGPAGAMVIFDSRVWHAGNANPSNESRVALAIRYAPWWLSLEVLKPGSEERKRMVEETGVGDNLVPLLSQEVFDRLPAVAQPLFRHWVAREQLQPA